MKLFQAEVHCDVCGGPGVSTYRDAASQWTGGKIAHRDPNVCRDYLEQKRRKLEEERKKLTAPATASPSE